MTKTKKLILLLLVFSTITFSQNLKLLGTAQPGNAMVGRADNIDQVILDNQVLQVDESGTFIFGFDRDDKGTHILKVKYEDGSSEIKRITLPEREFDIQKIYSDKQEFSAPPKEELPRIERERQKMSAARAKIGIIDTAYFKSGFTRPVKGGRIVGVFGSQRILNDVPKNIHNGLDIALPTGTPVYAMADGIVQLADENFYYNGTFVLMDHGQNLSSVYLHLSRLDVKTGDFVRKGEKIGEIGTTGRSTGPHLHWGILWNGRKIDPNSLLEISFD